MATQPPSFGSVQQQQQQQQQERRRPPTVRSQTGSEAPDSDSDWEDEDDFVAKKINIKIKPIGPLATSKSSASVDELRAAVGTWKMAMTNIKLVKPNSRRSQNQPASMKGLSAASFDATNSRQQIQPLSGRGSKENNSNNLNTLLPSTPASSSQPLPDPFDDPQAPMEPMIALFGANKLAPLIPPPRQPKQACLPVAFATQECLNVHTIMSSQGQISTSLLGHIKMAVPRSIIEMNPAYFKHNHLVVRVIASKKWTSLKTAPGFVEGEGEQSSKGGGLFSTLLSLDMQAIYEYARQRHLKHPESRYFLLPELASYAIRSHEDHARAGDGQPDGQPFAQRQDISPIQAVVHWLCALSVTKVRIDLEFLEDSLEFADRIRPRDVRNIKLSMQINGNVIMQQSRPEAVWSHIDSRITWSFATLQELMETCSVNGVSSCLAKLTLADGPSTPSATSLQFSISEKTICGVRLELVEDATSLARYKLTRHKQEVRTGTFQYEPPCL